MEDALLQGTESPVECELVRRAIADVQAGRPMRSEHPTYGEAYLGARMLAGVEAGRFIVAAVDHRTPGLGSIGAIGMYGEGSTREPAEFIDIAHLREAVAQGARIIDPGGADITSMTLPLQ